MTKAQKDAQLRLDRSARFWARLVLIGGLCASVGANALSARFAPIPVAIAAFPPVALFGSSMLLERLRTDWRVKVLMSVAVLVAGSFSWVHIAHVCMAYGQPVWISWEFPAIVDIPMLLSGIVLIQQRAVSAIRTNKVIVPQEAAKRAVPAKRTKLSIAH
jgi:hypothetical protein